MATPHTSHDDRRTPSGSRAAKHRAPRRRGPFRAVGALITVAGIATGIAVTGAASTAAPSPTIHQVEARIAVINTQAEKLTEAYDAARGQLQQVKGRAQAAHRTLVKDQAALAGMQHRLSAMVAAAYESAGLSGASALLDSGNPELILQRASDLGLVANARQAALAHAVAASRAVAADQATYAAQLAAERTTLSTISSKRQQIQALLNAAHAQLDSLQAAQRQRLAQQAAAARARALAARAAYQAKPAARSSGVAGSAAPASGAGATAVQFAYAQLGKPYVYGAAGPDSYDCSGLTMRAWDAAGVALSHNAAAQQGSIPAVSLSALQPGDLVFFGAPAYHVAIYVGNGNIIQAPHTGADVEVTPLSYMPAPSGAGRP